MPREAALVYTALWVTACAVAFALVARRPAEYAILSPAYRRLLLRPWRVVTGLVATLFFVVGARWAGDPTWDAWVGLMMSALTWLTAPWAVGALVRAAKAKLPRRQLYVAACAWMLSASWGYDLYNFATTGVYPLSWAANMAASSVIYLCAGLFWSLVDRPGTGVTFGFLHDEWPAPPVGGRDARIAGVAALFGLLVLALVAPFVTWAIPGFGDHLPWARW
ncbi:MAG: hypothetical protein R3A52_02475 [Polyangiales bacterium]